jgi:hypothetical protein
MQRRDDAVGEGVGEVSRRTDIGGKTPLGRSGQFRPQRYQWMRGFWPYRRPTGSHVSLCVFTFDVRGHLADSVLTGKTCTSDISTVISRL